MSYRQDCLSLLAVSEDSVQVLTQTLQCGAQWWLVAETFCLEYAIFHIA